MADPADTPGVEDPPRTLGGVLGAIGPGLIITANIVGTGELIATTKLGAQAGFTLLWFIVLGCCIKVFIQVELGRYAVSSGLSTLEAMDRLRGPRLAASWLVWLWVLMYVGTLLQASGIVGAITRLFVPAGGSGEVAGSILAAASCALLLGLGRYRMVERVATGMVVIFTGCTLAAVAALAWTPYGVSAADLVSGLSFRLPKDLLVMAVAAFGITGVGAGELIYYPYWCLEKGYARRVGPRDDSPEWAARARGWLRVMQIDAWLSFAVYTAATAAFYLLGAAVLHRQGLDVGNLDLVASLSQMYREAFGEWGLWVFLVGAFMVLYSTLFVSTASNARMAVDVAPLLRILRYPTPEHRQRAIRIGVVALPVFLTTAYLTIGEPVTLVLVGGGAQALMLPFLAMLALVMRHRWTDPRLRPGRVWTILLWLSFLSLAALGAWKLAEQAGAFAEEKPLSPAAEAPASGPAGK